MNKKSAIIFFLVLASVAATWLIEKNKPTNPPELIARMNQLVESDPKIKSYVWNYSNLAVGIIKSEVDAKAFARTLCDQFDGMGAKGIAVQVVDVLKLQKSGGDDWEEIAYAECQ